MAHEAFFKVLSDIAAADAMAYWIVGAMTALAFVIMRGMLPVKGLSYVFAPALFCGGLVGIYTLTELGFVVSSEKSAQTVAGAVAGMTAALFVMLLLTRLVDAVTRIRKPLVHGPGRSRA
jgi:hypothetical protein